MNRKRTDDRGEEPDLFSGQGDAPEAGCFASLDALNTALTAEPPATPGGTRAVPGEGPLGAAIALVGEQPGDEEDRQGRPFVGPAGQLLSRAMAEAGLERERCYLTNAVKRFKFIQRGPRRIHDKPSTADIEHGRWWLAQELELVDPGLVVALGATAGFALAGRRVAVTRERGPIDFGGRPGFLTVHPSYLLRLPDAAAKREAFDAFLHDLRAIRALAKI